MIAGISDDRATHVPGFDAFEFLPAGALPSQRLTYVLTRERIDPATANRTAPEPRMVRRIEVADERSFELEGEVRLAGDAAEETLLDALDDELVVIAQQRLRGNPAARGASAFDGDVTTAWQTPFDGAIGATVSVQGGPAAVDAVTVSWLDDEQHSRPTQLTLTAADGAVHIVDLPAADPVAGRASATIDVGPLDATTLSATISQIDPRTTPEDFSGLPRVLPVGLTELQLGDAPNEARSADEALDGSCRSDLIRIDGEPVAVRLIGSRGDALARSELQMESCEPIRLTAGSHRLDAAGGARTGFDIDRVVLDSAASSPAPATPPDPDTSIDSQAATSLEVTVGPSDGPTWLILQQSWNAGWTATANGNDLGTPVLINGYANAWLLPASTADRQIALDWAPQRTVTIALWLSLAAGVIVLALAIGLRRPNDEPQDADGRRAIPRLALAICLSLTVVVFVGPLVAIVAFAIAAAATRWRWLPVVVVTTCLAVVGVGISALEWRYDFLAAPDWPSRFGWASPIVWLAVVTVVVAALRPALRRSTPAHDEAAVAPVEH